ncbi:glutathione synthetase ATP-binding domain-like protein [Glonium stellatum]|uniref:Glutathione synthetase ATP-binding domain-like protein n=1 Tax=Glonium stellatum TaxID=574774 RepID=A0A8E2F9K5_9PEZI|nr:glutathione synthetase ATP-binding domain-like protein [Glonium stellatum]
MLQPESRTAVLFLFQAFRRVVKEAGKHEIAVKMIFPATDGYISRADFFEERLAHCPLTEAVAGFVSPLQLVKHVTFGVQENFLAFIKLAASGALLQSSSTHLLLQRLKALDQELCNRISLPWYFPTQLAMKRLAVIEGGFNLDFRHRVFEAAAALGIELVVLDRPGHWLQDPSFSSLRRAFLPVDLTIDDSLVQRVLNTLKDNNITVDGVTAFSDKYVVVAAEIAESLQLPTSPSVAFARVVDKHECRKLVDGDDQAICFSNLNKLKEHLQTTDHTFTYPLIIKPSRGGGSQGVLKVNNEMELFSAAGILIDKHKSKVLVESYIDGPEIDANYVLHNGEVIFFELSDNLPCAADKQGAKPMDSFLETGIMFPSGLDPGEIELIRTSVYESLRKLGFSTGVFHVEARIRNSSMRFESGEDGTVDLRKHNREETVNPSVFLIEVNARAPGRQATNGVAQVYGVDYNAVQLLFAVGESERAKALSQPFRNGPQFWCESVYLPATRGGVFKSDDVCAELIQRRPDLAKNIAECHCLFERGEIVPGPESGSLRWIASFLVFSRDSRSDALRLADVIRKEVRYELE